MYMCVCTQQGFPVTAGRICTCGNAKDMGLIRKIPLVGNGNSLRYFGLENSMDKEDIRCYSFWGFQRSDTTEHIHCALTMHLGNLWSLAWCSCVPICTCDSPRKWWHYCCVMAQHMAQHGSCWVSQGEEYSINMLLRCCTSRENKRVCSSYGSSSLSTQLMPCLPGFEQWGQWDTARPYFTNRMKSNIAGVVSRIPSWLGSLRLHWMEEPVAPREHEVLCSSRSSQVWAPVEDWGAVDGSPIALERRYRCEMSLCRKKGSTDWGWHCEMDFTDCPEVNVDCALCWCCAAVQCGETLGRTLYMYWC